jgi:hypothetical protein
MKKKIFIFQQRGWAKWIGLDLSRRLSKEGNILGFLTHKNSTYQRVINSEIKYEFLEHYENIMSDPSKYLGKETFEIEDICKELGINSIWEIMQSERNFTRSFRKKYYYSYEQNNSDEEIILYFKAIYKLCKKIIFDFKPDAIFLPNWVTVPHIMLCILSKKYKVKIFALTDTYLDDHMMISYDYLNNNTKLHTILKRINFYKLNSLQKKNFLGIKSKLKKKINNKNIILEKPGSLLKGLLKLPYKILKIFLDDIEKIKNFGPTQDSPGVLITIRNFFLSRLFYYQNINFKYDNFSQIKNFAYYSLQVQPEEAVDVMSAKFTNQFENIRKIAMSLPSGMVLIVKDHPAFIQSRNPKQLRKIANTPNVKLINPTISSGLILKKCKIVISVTGTVFSEAAYLGTPCIYLGQSGIIKLLPSVYVNDNLNSLPKQISKILKIKIDKQKNQKIYDNFIKAAILSRLPVKLKDMWEKGNINNSNLTLFYEKVKKEI